MFYKITVPENEILDPKHFIHGSGFYLVYISLAVHDLIYFNQDFKYFYYIDPVSRISTKILELFEEEAEVVPETEGYVSESFALKAMAIAKANTQTIKLTDIIK